MEILEISHNDSLRSIAQKCNLNFKQLAFSTRKSVQDQGRSSDASAEAMIADAIADLTNVTIPEEVAGQLAAQDISGQVSSAVAAQDIPGQISTEVSAQIPGAFPPVGACMLMQTDPTGSYPGTTWQQTDSVTTDTSVIIPLWERIA